MSAPATDIYVKPADRPRNIVYSKILDTAADVDVALRVVIIFEYDSKYYAAIGDNDESVFLLSADELFDCCVHGCAFVLVTNPARGYFKPFNWLIDSETGAACAYFMGINNNSGLTASPVPVYSAEVFSEQLIK